MAVFSEEQVERALADVPATASKTLRLWIARARGAEAEELAEACETELSRRGIVELDAGAARLHAKWADLTEGLDLEETIFVAFRELPPNQAEEVGAIAVLHDNPGVTHAQAQILYKKKHFSLVIGHFVYERLGAFRAFLPMDTISDLLISREKSPRGVRYTLRPETIRAWARLGIV